METSGREPRPGSEFIEKLGLSEPDQIERGYKLLDVYREAILEVNASGIAADQIMPDTRFVEDLDADSLEMIEVLDVLQERLNIDLPTEAFEDAETAGQVFEAFYGIAVAKSEEGPDDNLSGDREPRNPLPSAPSDSAAQDLPS